MVNVRKELIKIGLLENENDNKILIAENGGSVLFYVENSDNKLATELTRALMQSICVPFCIKNHLNNE